ncbi:sodium/proline symporter PutP [Halalkalibacillus sediminis]|uniref:Sodium/proline symporter n=1 Tax=Halalkalibacillus sediminis TaxID=2018042 RepID=A0A2I0QR15_9BACI|nr:sodium/proline symporter PutP [Halalkalibacillus sediminis]PKR76776.1 sodium/proline symporter PutP [Halalkalibacillus sediminis]
MDTATLVTFIVYIVGMLLLGVIGYKMTSNLSDYFLGGRKLGPGVAALSAGASDMSSWLILGLPGAIYISGLAEAWIAVGLTIGAYLNWQFVAKRLRIYTEVSNNAITIPDFFEQRFRDKSRALRIASAAVILLFFTFYTASGLVGGATLFSSSFGLSQNSALLIGSAVIIAYTFLGGFIAVSWTDFIQGLLMFLALIVLPIIAVQNAGGWNEAVNVVGNLTDGQNLQMIQGVGTVGIISSLAWGLGYFGQPHILARFMAIRSHKDVPTARFIGMTWMVLSLFGAVFVGIAGYAYLATADVSAELAERGIEMSGGVLENQETVFIALTQLLTHPVVAGILLAAILAAIMSTVDSQLLVSSSAVAEDFYKGFFRKNASNKELVWVARISVVAIAGLALLIASVNESLVLELVAYAWAGFGASFGPIILLALFWKRLTRNGALFGIITGAATVVIWAEFVPSDLYEIVPGFVLAAIVAIVVSMMGKEPSEEIQTEFEEARKIANS